MSTGSLSSMRTRTARAFPPPAYLTMPAVGIDISDLAIKYILFPPGSARFPLLAHGKIDLPIDVIDHGEIRDPVTISKHLGRIRDEYNLKYAHLSLPEEHAYLFQIDVQAGSSSELEQILEFQLKENVPLGPDEAVLDFNVLRAGSGTTTLNVSVYPTAIAQQYMSVVEEAGITVLSLEIEGQATARALLDETNTRATVVVDIGRSDSNISISSGGAVTFTASLEVGGEDLTRSIARGLDVSFQKAEQLKRLQGFRDTDTSGPVYKALETQVKGLADEVRRHITYWQMHTKNSVGEQENISRVVLTGGSANMAGLPEYLGATLGIPVEVGSVWKNVQLERNEVPPITNNESLEYATAIGLALRSAHGDH